MILRLVCAVLCVRLQESVPVFRRKIFQQRTQQIILCIYIIKNSNTCTYRAYIHMTLPRTCFGRRPPSFSYQTGPYRAEYLHQTYRHIIRCILEHRCSYVNSIIQQCNTKCRSPPAYVTLYHILEYQEVQNTYQDIKCLSSYVHRKSILAYNKVYLLHVQGV